MTRSIRRVSNRGGECFKARPLLTSLRVLQQSLLCSEAMPNRLARQDHGILLRYSPVLPFTVVRNVVARLSVERRVVRVPAHVLRNPGKRRAISSFAWRMMQKCLIMGHDALILSRSTGHHFSAAWGLSEGQAVQSPAWYGMLPELAQRATNHHLMSRNLYFRL